jgi:hypothetical protein
MQTLLIVANVPAVKTMEGKANAPTATVEMSTLQLKRKLAPSSRLIDKSEAKNCFNQDVFLSKALSMESCIRYELNRVNKVVDTMITNGIRGDIAIPVMEKVIVNAKNTIRL